MSTAREIYWALNRHRAPKLVAVLTEAKAAGVKVDDTWEATMEHARIDAADALGCRPEDIDLERKSHLDVLSDVIATLVRDEIERAGKSTGNSQSSYGKKA